MSNYRNIYEQCNGPIPKDDDGRSYDIHHIDGNHKNNSPENLKAVRIQEHYDIHYSRGDWAACLYIAARMKLSVDELSNLSIKAQNKRIEEGTHNFLSGEIQRRSQKRRVKKGIHNFQIRSDGSSISLDKVSNGTHHFLDGEISRKTQKRRVKEGTHHFLGPENNKKKNSKALADGTHNFLVNHPSKTKKTCPYCSKEVDLPNYNRWHGNNCKQKREE